MKYSVKSKNVKMGKAAIKTIASFGILVWAIFTISMNDVYAESRDKLAVIHLDAEGILQTPAQLASMVRTEMTKLNTYSVMDRYDMDHILKKNEVSLDDCYGTICASNVGSALKMDKIVTGSVERFGEKLIYNIRLIDVNKETIELSAVMEFENLQPHLQKMTAVLLREMFSLEQDPIMLQQLKFIEDPIVNNAAKLHANGPRMGLAYVTEGTATDGSALSDRLAARDAYPVLTQFGYQHEIQYLNAGNFQALFEIVGLATGMDQGMFIPSVSFLNGYRNSKTGLEVAFGPVFSLDKDADDYVELKSKWAWAMGKTFKSGHLNIPVNVYVTPNKKEGWFVGGSFGFNLAQRKHK